MNKALETYKKIKQDDKVVHLRDAAKRAGEYTEAYPLGYTVFDDALKGGVRDGDLIIGTGISGHGKSTMFENFSMNLSKLGFPCLFFSYEVVLDNLYAKFKEMGIKDEDFHIYVPKQNTSGNLQWVQEKIKEAYDNYSAKFIFIDHLDFLSPRRAITGDQRRIVLKDICQELKTMAVELRVIIFLIAHTKKVYGREIEMQDISESSGPYQIADFVFGITRESFVDDSRRVTFGDKSMIKVLKNRLTGEQPYMEFTLENNIIKPLGVEVQDFKKSPALFGEKE